MTAIRPSKINILWLFLSSIFHGLIFVGITKVQEWIKESLRKRLQKSLSHDWIHEKTSHKFPLRQYYVELQWNKKIRTAMGSQNVTLTSIHELIKQLGVGRQDQAKQSAATSHKTNHTSVLIEGEDNTLM